MKKLTFYLLLIAALSATQTIKAADYSNATGIDFIKIKAGCFNMGRDPNFEDGSDDELPRHKVCIKKSFYMGKTEVTQSQWVSVMGNNPSEFKGRSNPVEKVSWDDVQRFISRLNSKEGANRYRLPTEAEWEYAARAGSSSTYHFGDDKGALSQYAWFDGNSGDRTHPVAQKRPNQWGLYDMHGNVWEWVSDWYGKNYYRNSPTNDPQGASSGRSRVYRGGSWINSANYLRSALRISISPVGRSNYLGFRLVRKP